MWRTLAVATLALVGTADAQLPIPGKPPGFVLGEGSADAGVQLESYIDLVKRTWWMEAVEVRHAC